MLDPMYSGIPDGALPVDIVCESPSVTLTVYKIT